MHIGVQDLGILVSLTFKAPRAEELFLSIAWQKHATSWKMRVRAHGGIVVTADLSQRARCRQQLGSVDNFTA